MNNNPTTFAHTMYNSFSLFLFGMKTGTVFVLHIYDPSSNKRLVVYNYAYGGWNIVKEEVIDFRPPYKYPSMQQSRNWTYYTWGLDQSGTLQGAGGVGGLTLVSRDGDNYILYYDVNGNITEYVNVNSWAYDAVAHYEYDPYGKTVIASSGCSSFGDPIVNDIPFRFSSKYFNALKEKPCEPIVLVGHSYGGDTAMEVAKALSKWAEGIDNKDPYYLAVIELDPVSQFNTDTWLSDPRTDNINLWINVAPPEGTFGWVVDNIPVVGNILGGLWAGLGVVVNFVDSSGNNMIATGGGQWNNMSGADYNIDLGNINHDNVKAMMNLKFKPSPDSEEISLIDFINKIRKENCCDKKN